MSGTPVAAPPGRQGVSIPHETTGPDPLFPHPTLSFRRKPPIIIGATNVSDAPNASDAADGTNGENADLPAIRRFFRITTSILTRTLEKRGLSDSFCSYVAIRKGTKDMKIAVVQQPPVYMNKAASLEKAVQLISDAASRQCQLIVFPETWLPGYPTFVWRLPPGAGMKTTDELFALSQANSIDLSKDELAPVRAAAREHSMVVVMGHQEVDGAVSGSTLFNSAAIIDADGKLLNNHRKLMPTNPERMVWGFGDGSTLRVVETAVGRVGALICWENYMPLARFALYSQNIDIYCAPTWDSGDTWLATMQHVAREGGCWVVGCATSFEVKDVPETLPHRDQLFPDATEWINPGDAVIYKPFGGLHAGPMRKEKGLLIAEVDVDAARASRRKFDVSGHYARPDVFTLHVNRAKQSSISFDPG